MVKPQCLEVFRGAGCPGVGDPFRERWKLEELGVGGMQGSCKSGWVSLSSKVVPQGERIARFHSSRPFPRDPKPPRLLTLTLMC